MVETLSLTVIIAVAGFLQGLTGFGFALIALPLLGMTLPLKATIPLVCLLALCINMTLSFQLRNHLYYRKIFMLFLASLPGIPIGVYLLKEVPSEYLAIALGALMMAFTSYQLWINPTQRHLGNFATIVSGFFSGILGGSIGAGGPPVIIYATMQPWSKSVTKATLASFFALSGLLISSTHAAYGMITDEVLTLFLIGFPALAIGMGAGIFAYRHITDHGYRKLAFFVVFLLGCMMVYKGITTS